MATGTITSVVSIGGVTIQSTVTQTGDHINNYGDANTVISLPVAQLATAWVKTDADTAACNLTTGHGFTTGKMDVFWDVGSRYDVDVTVTVDAMALDGGVGDDFPATAEDTCVLAEVTQINTQIDGDEVQMFAIHSTQKGSAYFEDTGGALVARFELVSDEVQTWNTDSGVANPLTGNPITVCFALNGSTSTAAIITILGLEDSTP